MSNLHSTAGIVAIAAGVVAVIAVGWSVGLTVALRRLRAAQRTVLGDESRDLVAHAAHLQGSFESLAQYVEDFGIRLDRRLDHAEQRLDGTVSYRALVRYDAYGEMSGRQSTSLALLDATRSGIVLSSIHHRETARWYAKQIRNGEPELELSPEEHEAIRLALADGGSDVARQDARRRAPATAASARGGTPVREGTPVRGADAGEAGESGGATPDSRRS